MPSKCQSRHLDKKKMKPLGLYLGGVQTSPSEIFRFISCMLLEVKSQSVVSRTFFQISDPNSYGSHLVREQGPDQVSSSFIHETCRSISSIEEIFRYMFGKGQEGKLTVHTHDKQSTRGRHSLPDWRKPSWFSLLSDSLNFGNAETCLGMRIHRFNIRRNYSSQIEEWLQLGAQISDVGCGVTFIQWKYNWSQGNNESKSIAQRRKYRW